MPIYEYKCTSCGWRFEELGYYWAPMGVLDVTTCPECESTAKRIPTAAHPVFKGDGWTPKSYPSKGKRDK